MNQALLNSMTVAERRMIAETSRDAMAELDEVELLAEVFEQAFGRPRRTSLAAAMEVRCGSNALAVGSSSDVGRSLSPIISIFGPGEGSTSCGW